MFWYVCVHVREIKRQCASKSFYYKYQSIRIYVYSAGMLAGCDRRLSLFFPKETKRAQARTLDRCSHNQFLANISFLITLGEKM